MKINWGSGIVIALVIFAILLATAMIIGSKQRVDLVTPDYYEEELKFQEKINQRENAKELGSITFDITTEKVTIQFPSALKPSSTSGTIDFYKPDNANFDFSEDLDLNDKGQAIINRDKRIGGLWTVMIHAEQNGKTYYWEDSIRL